LILLNHAPTYLYMVDSMIQIATFGFVVLVEQHLYHQLAKEAEISLAEYFKWLRKRSGLSARALSQKSGLSPSYVSKLEAGDIMPSADAWAKLVTTLECSEAEVMLLIGVLANES